MQKKWHISRFLAYKMGMELIRAVAVIVGSIIGAGFISGAELVRFFPSERFFPPVAASFTLLFFMIFASLKLGKKYGGFHACATALCGRGAWFVHVTVRLASFVGSAALLAAIDGLYPAWSPFSSLFALIAVLLFVRKGVRGISACNLLLVPVILIVVFTLSGSAEFFYPLPPSNGRAFASGAVYAGLNLFLAVPVFTDVGAKCRHSCLIALLACSVAFVCAIVILGSVYREGANALNAEMPYLYVMRNSGFFTVASLFAIFTSLATSVYPLLSVFPNASGVQKNVARGVILLATFALSRVGLSEIVLYLYPVFGTCGIALLAVWVFHEAFFQKHNEKIHQRRKQTQNARRAHHEVKFEHLPAVDD